MISRSLKAIYYTLSAIPLRVNGIVYKAFRSPTNGVVKVHLGPGQDHYLPGWINVDANFISAKIDVWANLMDPLPFRDNSVDVFYSHHVIEHLPDSFLPNHCRELYRCLKPGGCIRIGGPHAESAARKFLEGDLSWFPDFPDSRKSLGGRFANFILCRGEHLTILTYSYLHELLTDSGFVDVKQARPVNETFHPQWIDHTVLANENEDTPEVPHTLLVEADKPSTAKLPG
ncbi:MAG: class I SAM-dependent methyltransferase [Gemmataceae bacterium]